MRKPLLTAILTIVVATASLHARQPAYFLFGADQFKGLQIYDVIQDPRHHYYISTNEGLYAYDFQRFRQIPCPDAKSNALFNFVSDSRGNIFASNINHQIFKITNLRCTIHYELRQHDIGSDLSLAIGPQDELLAIGRNVIQIDEGGSATTLAKSNGNFWGQPYKSNSGAVFIHKYQTDSVLIVRRDGSTLLPLHLPAQMAAPNSVLTFFHIHGQTFAVDQQTKALFSVDEKTLQVSRLPDNPAFQRTKSLRLYSVGGSTWIAGTLPGVFSFSVAPNATAPELFFEDKFISDVYEDHEGNILLSTFDEGILVVPDMTIPDVINAYTDDPIHALYVDQATGALYLGSSKGRLLTYLDGKETVLHPAGARAIESIHGTPGFPGLIFDDGTIKTIRLQTGDVAECMEAVLKDVEFMHPSTAYLATNRGLWKCSWDDRDRTKLTRVAGLEHRIHMLSKDNAGLLASTSLGLVRIDSAENIRPIQFLGSAIFPTAMTADADRSYLATANDGLLVVQGNQVTAQILPRQPQQETLRKIARHGDTFFAKSAHGIYQFNEDGSLAANLSKRYGFPDARIYDFAIDDSILWVSHARGVQAIDLSRKTSSHLPPILQIAGITDNDKTIDRAGDGDFSSGPHKFSLQLASPTLRHRESLLLFYRLLGYDPDWTTQPNDGKPVVYNALGPGDYTFEAKAENQGQFSAVVTYRFSIAAPLYSRWWFMLAAGACLLVVLTLIFRYQLRLQRKKAQQINELNASKLTAIQSQMNPHFIFNALNSIQDLVLKGDIENSYSYITTFSNLVRSTLHHSDKDFVDFEEELELLQLYLSLEQLRFKKSLRFEIDADDIEDIQVPPLLIQPFVENALVHGLLHKEGEKVLKIRFELQESLICTIEDNGIGRQRSKAIKERQRSEHESFSGNAIRRRFDILSEVFQGQFGYEYEDLVEDSEGGPQPIGTRVTLTIPVKRRF